VNPADVDPGALARWLTTRRWFGAKGRTLAAVELRAVAPLVGEPQPAVLACIHARFTDGGEAVYQAPLSATATEPVFDALTVPAVRRRLAGAFARGETIPGPDSRWLFESIDALASFAAPSEVLGGEQSNTSIVFAEPATIIKFYRRLEPGPQPDVEIARFLTTRTDFRGTPALLGAAHLDGPAGRCVTAIVQEFLPGAVDGWTHVLARLRADDDVTAELNTLGALTRELHAALASDITDPAFAPEPTSDADLERWRDAAASQARDALSTLAANQSHLPAALHPDINKILDRADALQLRLRAPISVADVGPRIRHHGDYHLGQVLRTQDGDWRILDFEGEPARPLAERRAKHHPLRDVAGMLRSFAYAAAVATPGPHQASHEQAMRAAFLAGYDDSLATDPRRAELLRLFTAEKLLYELAYELGSRPDWAGSRSRASPRCSRSDHSDVLANSIAWMIVY
jgi:maltokinase